LYDRSVLAATIEAYRDSNVAVALTTAASSAEDSTIVWVNAAFVELTGYSMGDAIGHSASLLGGASPDRLHMREVDLLHDHPERMPFGLVVTKQRPDGSWYDVEERIRPIRGPGLRTTHYLISQTELAWGHEPKADRDSMH
jgi:PAS domain S-box-containing protein